MLDELRLTPEQKAGLDEWIEKWNAIAFSTEPADFDTATNAALKFYDLSGFKRPTVIRCFGSPYAAYIESKRVIDSMGIIDDELLNFSSANTRRQTYGSIPSRTDRILEPLTLPYLIFGISAMRPVWAVVCAAIEDESIAHFEERPFRHRSESHRELAFRLQQWSVHNEMRTWFRDRASSGWETVHGRAASISVFRELCGYAPPALASDIFEALAKSCGFVLMFKPMLAISDRPQVINIDERGLLHSLTGPAIRYPDGWSIYAVHGIRVPAWLIEQPEQLTITIIDEEANAEIRRVMIDHFGIERYLTESNVAVIDECPADHPIVGLRTSRLLRKHLADDEPIFMLDMLNSTPESDGSSKRYMIRVDPNAYGGLKDCHSAMASTYRMPDGSMLFGRPEDYAPSVET